MSQDPYQTSGPDQRPAGDPAGQPPRSQPAVGPSFASPQQPAGPGPYVPPQQPYGHPPSGPAGPSAPYGQYPPYPTQPPYQQPPPPAPARSENRLWALADFDFTQYATPTVIRVLYVLLVVIGVLSWLTGIVSGFAWSGASGLGALVGGGIALVAWILLVRVSLEFVLAIVRVAQEAKQIREGLDAWRAERGTDGDADRG